jgi:putative colanic acid biosynthesis UDP-glucose lipid carrier transferase
MISDHEKFSRVIPNYDLRHILKPGITGMAQVKGFRGETNCFHDVSHRYKWDLFYVRNTSFILDLKIIHRTSVQTMSALIKPPETETKNVRDKPVTKGVSLKLIPGN